MSFKKMLLVVAVTMSILVAFVSASCATSNNCKDELTSWKHPGGNKYNADYEKERESWIEDPMFIPYGKVITSGAFVGCGSAKKWENKDIMRISALYMDSMEDAKLDDQDWYCSSLKGNFVFEVRSGGVVIGSNAISGSLNIYSRESDGTGAAYVEVLLKDYDELTNIERRNLDLLVYKDGRIVGERNLNYREDNDFDMEIYDLSAGGASGRVKRVGAVISGPENQAYGNALQIVVLDKKNNELGVSHWFRAEFDGDGYSYDCPQVRIPRHSREDLRVHLREVVSVDRDGEVGTSRIDTVRVESFYRNK